MYLVDLGLALDRERQVVEPRRVQLERLLLERLTQAERARPGHREPQVVDLLPALAGNEVRALEPERPEDRRVERERPLEVAANEIDVTDADQHCERAYRRRTAMRELPSGRVTLVFTDVEGSTRLLHELGSAYAEALAEHRRVVREASERHGGVEVDTQGDAFFIAFRSADDAVAALVAANERLADGPIHVRAGVHTGMPDLAEEGYVGLDVHLGARVAASGHGGQIVLSETAALALGEGAELRELGDHRLKDFADPIRLFQIGDDDFPPLKTISNTNLPHPASSFVGRAEDVAGVIQRVRSGARLATLTGPGGSGKTRLAIEAAQELVPDFPGGVFWIGLATVGQPELVVETTARTLGARDSLAAHIADRRMLLVLDNFEHVVTAAPEIGELVRACANLHVLVTSRELLRLRDEVELPVLPLAATDASALFAERSGLPADDTVEALCIALDNLPLAVELAAARVAVLSPTQILERLAKRLDLFRGGRDSDPRQETLRAAIDWSHELLTDNEQQLFARLAVFAGGCALDAAEAVAGADLDTLEGLVHKSLLRHSGERFWMLETIREYALERLGSDENLRRRHAEYYLELAEEAATHFEGHGQGLWLDRLEADYPNVRSAIHFDDLRPRFARALTFFWAFRGYLDEGRRIAGDALGPAPDDAELQFTAGLLTVMQGDYASARRFAERSRELALQRDDTGVLVQATNVLSRSLLAAGETDRAMAVLGRGACTCGRDIDHPRALHRAPQPWVHRTRRGRDRASRPGVSGGRHHRGRHR